MRRRDVHGSEGSRRPQVVSAAGVASRDDVVRRSAWTLAACGALGCPGDEAHVSVESICDALQCPGRRARGAALDPADVALVHPAALGELRLSQTVALTKSDDLQRDVASSSTSVAARALFISSPARRPGGA